MTIYTTNGCYDVAESYDDIKGAISSELILKLSEKVQARSEANCTQEIYIMKKHIVAIKP